MKMSTLVLLALSLTLGFVGTFASAQTGDDQSYESYFLYLGQYPSDANPGWHQDVQGISHDSNHWFISQTGRLWKIPVDHNLSLDAFDHPDTQVKSIESIPELHGAGYNHFGDLSHFEFNEHGYLALPVTGGDHPVIAFFRSDDLGYLGSGYVDSAQSDAGWIAIDPEGYLYSSDGHPSSLFKYQLDWAGLQNGVSIETVELIAIYDENGSPLQLHNMQGGVFSESGALLYLVSGYLDQHYDHDGINVIDTQTWRRLRRSSTAQMPFKYEFHPGYCTYEEPEGLTIWNLDDGMAPGIEGTLHVLMLDNDYSICFEDTIDDVYFKHYTEVINVDGDYTGNEEGTPDHPFNTVGEAYDLAWDGQRLNIQAGTYPETLMLSKRIQLLATGGSVVIGE